MKPGSKEWIRKMRMLIFSSRILILCVIPMTLFEWSSGVSKIGEFSLASRIMATPAIIFLALAELLSSFAPITENPNWKNVYPELHDKKKVK